jgi:broad specificity phosphatase PhoE
MTAERGVVDEAELDRLIDAAAADLAAAAGGGALCAISRSGRPAPAVKYHEGRWAALTEFRRARRQGDEDAADVAVRWRADLDRLTQQQADDNWLAYALGGVDALSDVNDDD